MKFAVSNIRDGMHRDQGQRELLLQDKIMELEERLHRKAQSEEERSVLLPNQQRSFLMKTLSSAALSSESSSSCIRQRKPVTAKTGNSDQMLKKSVKSENATKKVGICKCLTRRTFEANKLRPVWMQVVKEKALTKKKSSKEVRAQATSGLSSSAAKSKALKEVSGSHSAS